jgi:predicted O-methyltransferase YrrM
MTELRFDIEDGLAITYCNGVKGTLTQQDAVLLRDAARRLPFGGKYVETGSYLGCSSVIVGLHATNGSRVYAHDLWVEDMSELAIDGAPPPDVKDYFYQFMENIDTNKLSGTVIPIRGDSAYTLGIHAEESIDIAFIDGDHSTEGITKDLEMILPRMKKGGVVLCHDCADGSTTAAAFLKFCDEHEITDRGFFTGGTSMARLIK